MAQTRIYKGCKVVSVTDGDTITARVDLGFDVSIDIKVRMAWIDAPESRGSERDEGMKVKHYVTEKLWGQYVDLVVFKREKYGRWLADVRLNDESLPQHLLAIGYAVPYKV